MTPEYQVIVALGGGIDEEHHLGASSVRALAAATLLYRTQNGKLYLCGGATRRTSTLSEAEMMRRVICSDPELASRSDDLILETKSLNTAENVRNVVRIFHEHDVGTDCSILVVAGKRHKERACRYFRCYGFQHVTIRTAGDILSGQRTNYGYTNEMDPEPSPLDLRREKILRLLEIVDPKGRSLRTIQWLLQYL